MWLHVQGPFSQVDEPMNSPTLALLMLDESLYPLHCFVDTLGPQSLEGSHCVKCSQCLCGTSLGMVDPLCCSSFLLCKQLQLY